MPSSPSRRKHALLIGINTYPNLTKYEHLKGCINDVRAMARLLEERFGFLEEDVTVLEDAEATRAGILAALDALADRVGTDDVVVLFYAGHGSQVTDLEGDEPDGLDETICPYDTTREGGRNVDITDDELHAWILRVTAKTPFLTLLFDSCHSGTISRDPSGGQTRSLRPDTRPAEALGRTPVTTPATRSAGTEVGPSGWLPLGERYVLIAGCRDDERSKEYKIPESGERQGMLTYALLGALQDAAPGTTYRDVFERVRPAVNALNPKQHPQMEGALDRELFGVLDIEPMRFVGVERRDGATVTLAGGAAHGLTVGSEYAVYPPGTKTAEEAEALGRLVVRRVGALVSEADLEENEDGAVGPGARAVETAHAHPKSGLRVEVVGPEGFDEARAALIAEIEGSELLELAADGGGFDARAYLVPERAERADPVPQLGAVAEPTWAVVSGGELLMPTHPVSEQGVARLLRQNLEKIARYRYALALANPDAGSKLRGTLHVRLERLRADGTWEEATPGARGGEVVFHEGDQIGFTITHTHDAPLYIYALDFDIDGAVTPLAMAGANETLEPNTPFRVSSLVWEGGESHPIVLEFPERFPGTEGTATLKVFATTHETRFDFSQEGVRSAGTAGAPTPLQALILRAGGSTRSAGGGRPTLGDADWTTALRTYTLRRKKADLDDGVGVALGPVTIRTQGLDGEVRLLATDAPPTPSTRSLIDPDAAHTPTALDAVLGEEHVGTAQALEIRPAEVAAARTRSVRGEPKIELDVRAPGPEQGQFVLYTDEGGVTTWQFAEPPRTRSLDASTRRYVIDHVRPLSPVLGAPPGSRGAVASIGKKLLQVLVFPILDPLIGEVSERYAERWEGKKRPYNLRPFTPDDFQAPDAPALDGEAWRRLGAGRALLFIHGTFSRAHSAFGGLSAETVAELYRRYEGRVFAFDHFTLSHDPKTNIEWLLDNLPEDATLDLDIVCHSRGGLVSRVLAEGQSTFSLGARSLKVARVVFVASPNDGTALADRDHMGDLVSSYTNLLNLLPDNPVTDVLDGIVTVAKMLAVGALGGLQGLQAMVPGGDFLTELNREARQGDTRYFALGADFKPTHPGLASWAKSRLLGRIFGAENDLVVPTASVYADTDGDGIDLIPESNRHVFDAEAGIAHTTFFQDPAAQEKLLTWLRA